MKLKLCSECVHFVPPPVLTGKPPLRDEHDNARCARSPTVSLVNGMQTINMYCQNERRYDGLLLFPKNCGPKGKYWVQA